MDRCRHRCDGQATGQFLRTDHPRSLGRSGWLSRKGRYRRVRSQIRKAVKAQFGLRPYAVPARGSTGRGRRERQKNPCPTALPLGYGRGSSFLSSIPFCRNWNIQQRTDLIVQNQRPSVSTMSSRSEEHTSELQSLMRISYAVFCLQKKKKKNHKQNTKQQDKTTDT